MARKMNGIEVGINKFENGLWYDSDQGNYDPKGWGIKLGLVWGLPMVFPVVNLRKWLTWAFTAKDKRPILFNRWEPENQWCVIRWKNSFGLFFSLAIKSFGMYAGMKPNKGDSPDSFILSGSIRRSRWV